MMHHYLDRLYSGMAGIKTVSTFKNYFLFPLKAIETSIEQRVLMYLTYSFTAAITTFISLKAYGIRTDAAVWLPFLGVYTWHTAINFSVSFILVTELFRFLFERVKSSPGLNVTFLWLAGFTSFLIAFLVQRTIVYSLVDTYYPDLIIFYNKYPFTRPGFTRMFFWCFVFWFPAFLLLVQLMRLHQIRFHEFWKLKKKNKIDQLILNNGETRIDMNRIVNLSMEDHYARIYWVENGRENQTLVRMTLKEALNKLSIDCFIQIHRSHVVNLSHVQEIVRNKNSWVVLVGQKQLPISKSRLKQVKELFSKSSS